jgi:hypothetical protein
MLGIGIKHPRKYAFCGAKQGDPKVILYPFPNDEVRMDFVRRVLPDFGTNTNLRLCNGHLVHPQDNYFK